MLDSHLLLSTVKNGTIPSFMELKILERIEMALHPALAAQFSSSSAGSTTALLPWLLIQFYCIERTGASMGELFFGIRRVSTGSEGSGPAEMSVEQRRLSFALLTLTPRLVAYLNVYLKRRHASTTLSALSSFHLERMSRVQRMWHSTTYGLYRALPVLESTYGVLSSAQQLAYMFGATRHYNPIMMLLGIEYNKQLGDVRGSSSSGSDTVYASTSTTNTVAVDHHTAPGTWDINKVLIGLLICVKAADFLTRNATDFLRGGARSWGLGDGGDGPSSDAVRIPDVPDANMETSDDMSLEENKCSVCKRVPQGACASSGGFVFCYYCLRNAVDTNGGKCPISGIPCHLDDIIQIFTGEGT